METSEPGRKLGLEPNSNQNGFGTGKKLQWEMLQEGLTILHVIF